MFFLFAATLLVVGLYLGRWTTKRRETIRLYRDRLAEAREAEERADEVIRRDASTP